MQIRRCFESFCIPWLTIAFLYTALQKRKTEFSARSAKVKDAPFFSNCSSFGGIEAEFKVSWVTSVSDLTARDVAMACRCR